MQQWMPLIVIHTANKIHNALGINSFFLNKYESYLVQLAQFIIIKGINIYRTYHNGFLKSYSVITVLTGSQQRMCQRDY